MNDALLALRLFALDPVGLGGVWLRGSSGPAQEAWLETLVELVPIRRVPVGIDDDRLIGGVDLGASLAAGRPVRFPGVLAEAQGSVVVVQGAERAREMLTGRLAQAMDGLGPAAILVDEGGEDEGAPAALTDRVAFHLDLDRAEDSVDAMPSPASETPGAVAEPEQVLQTIAAVAQAFGIGSTRATIFTLRAARAHAALCGRTETCDADVTVAARLVLAPRATRMPVAEDASPAPDEADDSNDTPEQSETTLLEDVVLAAVKTALPARLLEELAAGHSMARGPAPRGSGACRRSPMRGRPVGTRPGVPGGGLRLALVDTLRAAAPWQKLRGGQVGRIALRKADFRVRRFEDHETVLTVFAVDASGSAAFTRLAEAKGAVELLLQRAYATRSEVALIAFRGTGAELLLPPTRSLTRARRELADLPGGGGTPLAAGLNAAHDLAEAARKRGRTPQIVVLTDGRANIAADGAQGRDQGTADALAAGRRMAVAGMKSVVIDIGPRNRPEAVALAEAMGAKMVHLPRADAAALSTALAA